AMADRRAIRRTLRGDREAFGDLMRRYRGPVHALCYSYVRNHADAEDLCQEAFIRVYTKLNSLSDPAKFGSWLMTTARNLSLNLRAKHQTAAAAVLRAAAEPSPTAGSDPETPMADAHLHTLLQRQLDQMPDDQREVLFLHYFEGKSTADIARLLEVSREAAKKRLQRAREALGTKLTTALESEAATGRISEERLAALMRAVVAVPAPWLAAGSAKAAG